MENNRMKGLRTWCNSQQKYHVRLLVAIRSTDAGRDYKKEKINCGAAKACGEV